ncbi:hypothetical protein J2W96_006505 [Variovorax guangxiensis]|nr:hypothetical protein [Variovorax guangxiensis]
MLYRMENSLLVIALGCLPFATATGQRATAKACAWVSGSQPLSTQCEAHSSSSNAAAHASRSDSRSDNPSDPRREHHADATGQAHAQFGGVHVHAFGSSEGSLRATASAEATTSDQVTFTPIQKAHKGLGNWAAHSLMLVVYGGRCNGTQGVADGSFRSSCSGRLSFGGMAEPVELEVPGIYWRTLPIKIGHSYSVALRATVEGAAYQGAFNGNFSAEGRVYLIPPQGHRVKSANGWDYVPPREITDKCPPPPGGGAKVCRH